MTKKGRQFTRPKPTRRIKKMFVVAVEGTITEVIYFNIFNNKQSVIAVKILKKGHGSAPDYVLRSMKKHIAEEGLKKNDEAWLVVDKNGWSDEQLTQLHNWSKKNASYNLALSNPKFECWLLLHFEKGNLVKSSNHCSERLCRYLPDYDKKFDPRKITREMIDNAVSRAKNKDNPPCEKWPTTYGSTVYRLVEKILNA